MNAFAERAHGEPGEVDIVVTVELLGGPRPHYVGIKMVATANLRPCPALGRTAPSSHGAADSGMR